MGRGEGAVVVELGAGDGALNNGGGSIEETEECEMNGLLPMTGSGKGERSSSFPVSMVISLVGTDASLRL